MTLRTIGGKVVCPVRVGDILVTETSSNPSGTYPGTTWKQVCVGRVPVGVNTSETEFNAVNKTGGEKTHKLTIDEMPSHKHGANGGWFMVARTGDRNQIGNGKNAGFNDFTNPEGGSKSHNNLQPYETKYFWKRLT